MRTIFRCAAALAAVLALAAPADGQNANITQPIADIERLLAAEPLVIVQAVSARPKAVGNITLKAEISFGGAPPLTVKLRKAEPGAESFNNTPRYDIAAYAVQKLFLDPADYVVPPTVLRMVPRTDFAKVSPGVERTFTGSDDVVAVVQYWLSDIIVVADVYDPKRFAADPLYARHIGQLNLLTYLISHGDSNVGNFLIGREATGPRVFSIDNGVAFAAEESDRGTVWKRLRVTRLPADAIARLRQVTPELLADRLGVLAQWQLQDGRYVPVTAGANLGADRGVRLQHGIVQMGLTRSEIVEVQRLLKRLLAEVDRGRITLAPAPPP